MQRAPLVPELTLCNRFVRQAIAGGVVYGISDGRRLADVQSRGRKAVRTALLWTVHGEVERWASVLIDNPSVETFSLSRLACEVFPQLHASGRLVGTDWSADPIEPEVDPYELLERLRNKALECFLHGLRTTRALWIVEDANGPVVAGSVMRPAELHSPASFTARRPSGMCRACLKKPDCARSSWKASHPSPPPGLPSRVGFSSNALQRGRTRRTRNQGGRSSGPPRKRARRRLTLRPSLPRAPLLPLICADQPFVPFAILPPACDVHLPNSTNASQ